MRRGVALGGWIGSFGIPIALITLVGGAGCSSSPSGAAAVTTLPSSDPVASNPDKFCSDAVNYIVKAVPSQFFCALEDSQSAECMSSYPLCVTLVDAIVSTDSGVSDLSDVLTDCDNLAVACKG